MPLTTQYRGILECPQNPALHALKQPMWNLRPHVYERVRAFAGTAAADGSNYETMILLGVRRPARSVKVNGVDTYLPFETAYPPSWFTAQQNVIGPDAWMVALTAFREGLITGMDPNMGSGVPLTPVPYPPAGTLRRAKLNPDDTSPDQFLWE